VVKLHVVQLNSTQLVKDLGHRQKAASSRKVVEKEKVADRKMVARLGEEKNKKVKKGGA
jgi:hypothetical protein